jgi:hypothetical protein
MAFPIKAQEVWEYEFVVVYAADQAGDINLDVALPAGCTRVFAGAPGLVETATGSSGSMQATARTASGTGQKFGGNGAAVKLMAVFRGIARNGATPGTVQLRAAQGTSSVVASTIFADSWFSARRIVSA